MKKFFSVILILLVLCTNTSWAHNRHHNTSGGNSFWGGMVGGILGGIMSDQLRRNQYSQNNYYYQIPPYNYQYPQYPQQPGCYFQQDPYNPYVYRKVCQ
jgi:hypothetical protein